MSTPVSVTTPPHSRSMLRHSTTSPTAVDMRAKMQLMIDLQYEQQRCYATADEPLRVSISGGGDSGVDHQEDSLEQQSRNHPQQQQHQIHQSLNAPHSPFPDANVGKGTLIWRSSPSSDQQRLMSQHRSIHPRVISSASTQGDDGYYGGDYGDDDDVTHMGRHPHHHSHPQSTSIQYSMERNRERDSETHLLQKTQSTHYSLSSYGATTLTTATTDTTLDNGKPPPPPPLPRNEPPLRQHQHQQQSPHQEYHDNRYVAQHVQDAFRRHDERERQRRQWSLTNCVNFLLGPFRRFWYAITSATSLHRSFCYGAIDGMLTGAGIVSTFCGMRLLSTTTNNSPPIRALVVAFTAATCCADAVCMALGHIWTTHVLASAQASERAQALQQLHQSKADAKGLLVDMLLSKGVLKIDAMSLTDTLEGYPDLFVSALIGESLSGGVVTSSMTSSTRSEPMHYPTLRQPDMLIATDQSGLMMFDTSDGVSPGADALPSDDIRKQRAGGSHPEQWQSYPSYDRLDASVMDPNVHIVHSAEAEARKESLSMMLGFCLFSVIPSLIYTWVPAVLFGSHDAAGIHINPSSQHVAAFVNPNTLVISLTACVMWCLGVWKSRFLDSNWLLFGIETVLVLLVCIAVAYGLGALLNKIFLPNDYLLEVVKQIVPSESGHSSTVISTVSVEVPSGTTRPEQIPSHHIFIF